MTSVSAMRRAVLSADSPPTSAHYDAARTTEVAKRQRLHPSHVVHRVSWTQYLNKNNRPNIQRKVLEEAKDAFILSNVLSPAECQSLIRLSERHGFVMLKSAERGGSGRTNTRVITDDKLLAAMLYRRVKDFLPKSYRMRGDQWDLIGLNGRFRCCKYVEGQSFQRIHCDKWVDLPAQHTRSLYTVNIYLNAHGACYRGGRTIFFDHEDHETSSLSAKTGDALIFNHFPRKYRHCGEMLSSGIKYIFRSDVMFRRRSRPMFHSEAIPKGIRSKWWNGRKSQSEDDRERLGQRKKAVAFRARNTTPPRGNEQFASPDQRRRGRGGHGGCGRTRGRGRSGSWGRARGRGHGFGGYSQFHQ